jgi:hypothetical protein
MGIPDFNSIQCIKCGLYNLQTNTCIIFEGDAYCISCFAKSNDLQNRLWEYCRSWSLDRKSNR